MALEGYPAYTGITLKNNSINRFNTHSSRINMTVLPKARGAQNS
jgi:hypothetical protein